MAKERKTDVVRHLEATYLTENNKLFL